MFGSFRTLAVILVSDFFNHFAQSFYSVSDLQVLGLAWYENDVIGICEVLELACWALPYKNT